jgi:hypothetical protein
MQSCRLLAVILVASIVLSIFWAVPFPTVKATDGQLPPGWLSGYTYRKKHTITGATNAGIDYQMMFKVRRASGNDSDNIVYLSTKCKADYSDVRFADADGNIFPYAITYKSSDEAWFWIKPSLDLSTDQNIYIYYGNPDAQDQSSLDNTFIFAEDWSSPSLNSRWTVDSQGEGYVIDPSTRRIQLKAKVGATTAQLRSNKTLYFPSFYRVEQFSAPQYETSISQIALTITAYLSVSGGYPTTRVDFSLHNYVYNDPGVAFASFHATYYSYNAYYYALAGVGHNDDYSYLLGTNAPGTYTSNAIIQRNASGFVQVYWKDDWRVNEYNTESPDRIYLRVYSQGSTTNYAYFPAFKVRKYVNPEPGHGAWYAEEQATTVAAKLNVDVEPSWLSYVAFTLDYPTQILFAPWSSFLNTGSHTVTVLDSKITVNSTYVYGFKCWKKAGEIVSFDKSYTFNLAAGTTDITIVYIAHNVTIVSDPEMYVRLTVDGWQVTTPATIYRGSGYYNFEALDTKLYYNATHILTFYGWYVDNIYIGSSSTANIYISYNTQIKLAYKAVEIPAPPPMTFKAQIVDLGTVPAGTSKDFAITVMFDATTISIESVEFQARGEWLQITDTLPMQASRGLQAMGTATIQARLTAPQNTQGYYSIPFKVIGKTSDGTTITTASYLTFTITAPTQITETTAITAGGFAETITRIIGNPILLMLLIALIIWLSTYSLKKH